MSALSLAARRAAPLLGRRAFSTAKPAPAPGLKNVVLVDGCRTPFQPACTAYNKEAGDYEQVQAKRGQPLREGFWIVKVRCMHDAPHAHLPP